MSNKLQKTTENGQSAGMEITGQIIEYVLAAVAAAICMAVPLYARNGYDQIGNAKFEIYKNILCLGLVPLLILTALYGFFWLREKQKCRLSVTDGFVLAYLFLTVLAAISGGFWQDALWGSFGWNMGLMAQISFVLLYFLFSRFGKLPGGGSACGDCAVSLYAEQDMACGKRYLYFHKFLHPGDTKQ